MTTSVTTDNLVIDATQICYAGGTSDPVGRVFFWQGRVFRGVYSDRVAAITELLHCGLIQELESKRLFTKTVIFMGFLSV